MATPDQSYVRRLMTLHGWSLSQATAYANNHPEVNLPTTPLSNTPTTDSALSPGATLMGRGGGARSFAGYSPAAPVNITPKGVVTVNPATAVDPNDPATLEAIIKAQAKPNDPTAGVSIGSGGTNPLNNTPGSAGKKPAINLVGGTTYTNQYFEGDFGAGVPGYTNLPLQVNQNTKGQMVITRPDGAGNYNQVIIAVDPNDPTQYMVQDAVTGIASMLQKYPPGSKALADLKNTLAKTGKYKSAAAARKSGFDSGFDTDFLNAFTAQVNKNTFDNFTAAKNGQKTFSTVENTITNTPYSPLAGTRETTTTNITPQATALMQINTFMQEQLGRQATYKEVSDYTQSLNSYEKAHPDRNVVTTDALMFEKNRVTYAGASPEDQKAILVGVLYNELSAKGVNPDAISKSGGAIAQGMQAIQKTAADYGLGHIDNAAAIGSIIDASKVTASKMTNADTFNLVKETLKPGGSITNIETKLKEQAKLTYKPLASYIDAGGNVMDIANQFNALNQKYLETFTPTNVFDPTIQKALAGDGKNVMNSDDYIKMLKSDPSLGWSKTQNAREEAANYVTTIGKEFGFMA